MFQQELAIKINDIELFCHLYGEGPPLVLLHGFFLTSAQWEPFLAEFTSEYRLVIPDLRGHGRSTNLSNTFTHRQAALDIYALLDKLGIRFFRAMGVSTGAMTLLHMAIQQPERIEAMVLFSATNRFPKQAREMMQAMTFETAAPEFLEMLDGLHVGGTKQLQALFNQFRQFSQSYDDMNFTQVDLSKITAKTLIVHGDRDEFFPVSIPMEIYQAIPDASLWIIPNSGHTNLLEAINHCAGVKGKFPTFALKFLSAGCVG